MAANKNLDPATCNTAEEAFKYPLPQVRQFHRNLTLELDEKNGRLRTLVGGSYRQLLGTAEMILQMKQDIGDVEDKLGRVGEGCGREVLGSMVAGLGKFRAKGNGGRGRDDLAWMARLKVLGMCGVVVGRLLRRGGSIDGENEKDGRGKNLVLAAKVWVLSRLLVKSLNDSASFATREENELVEEARRKLATLKKKLLRAVVRTLEKIGGDEDRENLVQALCAYSLATSYGAKDVLHHFLQVRGDAMALALDEEADLGQETPGVLRALDLYTRTLRDVQALVPRRLSEALAGLKTKALLKDEAIRELDGLRLDVCDRWFGDEILYFTPYVRHDDLEGVQAVEKLKGWAKHASGMLLQGFTKTLERIASFKNVVELRTNILQAWINEGGKARGFDASILLDAFRNVINGRMVQLLESRVDKLHLVGTEIEATLGAWQDGLTDKHESLWDEDILAMEISNGASSFKQSILSRTHGRNDAVSRVISGYQTWRHFIDEITDVLDQLRKQRWDDDLEEIEDDLSLESRHTILSKEDPQMLQDRLDASLAKSYMDLNGKIAALYATHKDSEHIGPISIYLLRILRDIRAELLKNSSLQSFGLPLIPILHERLAISTSADYIAFFAKPLPKTRVVGRALWEGKPELPIQPSPGTFKFLHSIAMAMAKAGPDLWSPSAVDVLKRYLSSESSRGWGNTLNAWEDQFSNNATEATDAPDADTLDGDKPDGNTSIVLSDGEKRNEILTQLLFDILVLQCSLKPSSAGAEDALEQLENTVVSKLELGSSSQKRLEQAAKEFWKRTGLLFGLLA